MLMDEASKQAAVDGAIIEGAVSYQSHRSPSDSSGKQKRPLARSPSPNPSQGPRAALKKESNNDDDDNNSMNTSSIRRTRSRVAMIALAAMLTLALVGASLVIIGGALIGAGVGKEPPSKAEVDARDRREAEMRAADLSVSALKKTAAEYETATSGSQMSLDLGPSVVALWRSGTKVSQPETSLPSPSSTVSFNTITTSKFTFWQKGSRIGELGELGIELFGTASTRSLSSARSVVFNKTFDPKVLSTLPVAVDAELLTRSHRIRIDVRRTSSSFPSSKVSPPPYELLEYDVFPFANVTVDMVCLHTSCTAESMRNDCSFDYGGIYIPTTVFSSDGSCHYDVSHADNTEQAYRIPCGKCTYIGYLTEFCAVLDVIPPPVGGSTGNTTTTAAADKPIVKKHPYLIGCNWPYTDPTYASPPSSSSSDGAPFGGGDSTRSSGVHTYMPLSGAPSDRYMGRFGVRLLRSDDPLIAANLASSGTRSYGAGLQSEGSAEELIALAHPKMTPRTVGFVLIYVGVGLIALFAIGVFVITLNQSIKTEAGAALNELNDTLRNCSCCGGSDNSLSGKNKNAKDEKEKKIDDTDVVGSGVSQLEERSRIFRAQLSQLRHHKIIHHHHHHQPYAMSNQIGCVPTYASPNMGADIPHARHIVSPAAVDESQGYYIGKDNNLTNGDALIMTTTESNDSKNPLKPAPDASEAPQLSAAGKSGVQQRLYENESVNYGAFSPRENEQWREA